MVYYPMLRTKQNEVLAVRELSATIAQRGNIFPIFEPVRGNITLVKSLTKISRDGVVFGLVVNPTVGPFVGRLGQLNEELIDPLMQARGTFVPFIFITRTSTVSQFNRFLIRFPQGPVGTIIDHVPDDGALFEQIASMSRIEHIVAFEQKVPARFLGRIPEAKRVLFADRYHRALRNADYPFDEFFCEKSNPNNGGESARYGDYSIAGAGYTETGGPAYAVAIHHIYRHRNGDLHIRHYLSDETETPTDPGAKFIEALRKLVADLPRLGESNNTPTCALYRSLLSRRHFPNLGPVKKLALKHHFELLVC